MKSPRSFKVVLVACVAAVIGAREGRAALCGIPNIYGVQGTAAGSEGFVALYSPIFPFPPTGTATITLGSPYGDMAYQTILTSATTAPPKFMLLAYTPFLPPPPGADPQCFIPPVCSIVPGAIVYADCPNPFYVYAFN